MSSMEPANDEIQLDLETQAKPGQKQSRHVFFGFAATITIGLALAGWYVGGRIFTGEKVHAAVIAKPVSPATPIAIPAVVTAKPVESEAIEEPVVTPAEQPKPAGPEPVTWNMVDPQSGELYLQLAAMGPNSTNDYLKTLDAKGIHPRIAPGPSQSLHRLLIGPYPDMAALEREQKELESTGIQSIAHRY